MPGEKARNQASAVSGRKNILNIRQNIAEGPSINGDIEVGSVAKVALPAYCSDRVHALAERKAEARPPTENLRREPRHHTSAEHAQTEWLVAVASSVLLACLRVAGGIPPRSHCSVEGSLSMFLDPVPDELEPPSAQTAPLASE